MRRIYPHALAAALLALGIALPAGAQDERATYRSNRAYGELPSAPAVERIAGMAHEIERLAGEAHRRFERNNRRPSPAEARVTRDLHALAERGEHFHDQVETHRSDRRHLRGDFAALEEAFSGLGASLRYIRPRDYVDDRLDRIDVLMDEIGRALGRPRAYGHWRDRDRRYGDHNGYYDPYGDRRYDDRRDDDRDRDRWDDRRDDDHDDD